MRKIGMMMMAIALIGAMSCGGKKGDGKSACCEKKSACCEAKPHCVKKEKKVVVARLAIKEGQEKAFIEIAAKLVEATRNEEGNLFYSVYQSPLNGAEFLFYEEYKDEAAFKTHSESAHFAAFVEAIKNLTAGDLIVDDF